MLQVRGDIFRHERQSGLGTPNEAPDILIPERPTSSYFQYTTAVRPGAMQSNPGRCAASHVLLSVSLNMVLHPARALSGLAAACWCCRPISIVNKQIGKQWKALPDNEKKVWQRHLPIPVRCVQLLSGCVAGAG